ncbi:MAG: hypothetical protein R2695_18525 [Acidimicrobiales bacterium]
MTVAELNAQRLQARFADLDVEPLHDLPLRRPARFGGEVRGLHHSGHDGLPVLRVTFSDGTDTATAVFSGRRRIRGFEAGRIVLFEGVARREKGRLVVLNPAYTLVP